MVAQQNTTACLLSTDAGSKESVQNLGSCKKSQGGDFVQTILQLPADCHCSARGIGMLTRHFSQHSPSGAYTPSTALRKHLIPILFYSLGLQRCWHWGNGPVVLPHHTGHCETFSKRTHERPVRITRDIKLTLHRQHLHCYTSLTLIMASPREPWEV